MSPQATSQSPTRIARFPNLRPLAWSGDFLYASRGYELLRARVENPSNDLAWQTVGTYQPRWNRRLSVSHRLTARLFRDGFHALAVLPSGGLVAAVPGAILTLPPGETESTFAKKVFEVKNTIRMPVIMFAGLFCGFACSKLPG